MKPPKRSNTEFEKVKCGDFITGVIDKVEYDEEHTFRYQGKEKVASAVRLIFKLDGYKFPHYTRWMTFSYGEKTNLLNKYLVKLVEGAYPDMDFDLDRIIGMKVKTIWAEKNDFQYVELIQANQEKIQLDHIPASDDVEPPEYTDEEIPF